MFSVPSWATWRHGAKDAFATKKNFWRDHRFITAKEWHDIPILHATTRADVRRSWLQECWMRRCVWWWPHLSVRSSPPAMAFPKSSRDTSLWTFILQLIKQCWRFKSKPSIGSCYRGNLQFQVTPDQEIARAGLRECVKMYKDSKHGAERHHVMTKRFLDPHYRGHCEDDYDVSLLPEVCGAIWPNMFFSFCCCHCCHWRVFFPKPETYQDSDNLQTNFETYVRYDMIHLVWYTGSIVQSKTVAVTWYLASGWGLHPWGAARTLAELKLLGWGAEDGTYRGTAYWGWWRQTKFGASFKDQRNFINQTILFFEKAVQSYIFALKVIVLIFKELCLVLLCLAYCL